MTDFVKWKKKVAESEEKRIGDVHKACVGKGCERRFLELFDSRIWLFPKQQTKAFMTSPDKTFRKENNLRQWKIYLETLIELRPHDDMVSEWRASLAIINNGIGYEPKED